MKPLDFDPELTYTCLFSAMPCSDCDHLLPMPETSTEIFETVKDGVLLCKLLNYAVARQVERRAGPL